MKSREAIPVAQSATGYSGWIQTWMVDCGSAAPEVLRGEDYPVLERIWNNADDQRAFDKKEAVMPKTLAKIDSLLSRALERESLFAIASIVAVIVQGWKEGGAVAAVSVAMTLGRSWVKRGEFR